MSYNYKELAEAIIRGDQQAFGFLFEKMYSRLCVYAVSFVGDEESAKDIVQQAFVSLWENRKEIPHTDAWNSYLYRTVYHTALNHLKHEKLKSGLFEFLQQQEAATPEVEYIFDDEYKEQLLQQVHRIIDQLPAQCKSIFLLSRFSGKKSTEIARELGLSVRTVEHQLYRAMRVLRNELNSSSHRQLLIHFLFRK